MFAVDKGHKDIVQRLVSAGADVHIRDKVCGDIESVCQILHVPNGLGKIVSTIVHVYEYYTYMCTNDVLCTAPWTRPFSRIAHVHEERGKGREGHYVWFMRLMYA